MSEKELLRHIAQLETINDQLMSEIFYLEKLTKALGFVDGLETLKSAALEMLEEDQTNREDEANPPLSN
jgi:hypothetical protein